MQDTPIEIYPLHRLDFRACLAGGRITSLFMRNLVESLDGGYGGEVETRLAQQRIIGAGAS